MPSKSKVRRYRNLIKDFSNWPQYLWFKAVDKQSSFNFKLRDSFSVKVPRQMLSAFRECFFDQIYLKHLPEEALEYTKPIVVDIGANVGFFSLFMFSRYPKANIYSFEPMPYNFRVLQDYQKEYANFNWHTDDRAISDSNQSITLHASTLEGYTTMASVFDKSSNQYHIEREAITLSQVQEIYGLKHIDILKLDCEGSEYAILYSLPEHLLKKIKVLIVETHQGNGAKENLTALKTYLEQQDFNLNYLDEGREGYLWAWKKT